MMTCKQVERILHGAAMLEYNSNWYWYIGESSEGHIFFCYENGDKIYVKDAALRNSSEFFYSECP